MAKSQPHIQQWVHNRQFLATIGPQYPDWIVTAAFYVAVHAVDALLAHDQVARVASHEARNSVLTFTNRYKKVSQHFRVLYTLSRTVRYVPDPTQWVPTQSIEKDVLRRYLYPIEASVQKLMGVDLALGDVSLAT